MPPIPKPAGCLGCPFYSESGYFVPDELVDGAAVMVYGQNPGATEEAEGRPFVGATGVTMDREYFPLAGVQRGSVSIGNAIRCRWRGTNELPPLEQTVTRQAVAHCTKAHLRVTPSTKVIVAQGAYSLWALTGEGMGAKHTITSWRGYALPLAYSA